MIIISVVVIAELGIGQERDQFQESIAIVELKVQAVAD